MLDVSIINAVRSWERKLEIEDESRKAQRVSPFQELPGDFPAVSKRTQIFLCADL